MHKPITVTADTPLDIKGYQALTIAHALEFYARHGMLVNTAYKPKVMMQQASNITGLQFKPRQYTAAAGALREWATARVANRRANNEHS